MITDRRERFLDTKFFSIIFDIRTEFQSGILFFIHGGPGEYLYIQVEDGTIASELSCEEGAYVFRVVHDKSVCDGEWHKIQVLLNLDVLVMRIDGGDWYLSAERSPEHVYIQATEAPTFGGIKPGSKADEFIEEMNLRNRGLSSCKNNFSFYGTLNGILL